MQKSISLSAIILLKTCNTFFLLRCRDTRSKGAFLKTIGRALLQPFLSLLARIAALGAEGMRQVAVEEQSRARTVNPTGQLDAVFPEKT
jgi:hypothetical protein